MYMQYYDGHNNYKDDAIKILYVVNQLPKFEQDVFYLYAEYNSLRQVADETNVSRQTICTIMNKIKVMVKLTKLDDIEDYYI